ncbi:MAG: complex I NDUFA9 subunit family protein [candidate division Zixibacteria bacterium]|nr:complex I NDUFA9 subunit family protein [candidate division Zixibacteria bacterium]
MNVAIAGGTGFIGKVIIKKLVESGHHVKALIRPGALLKIASFSGTESQYVYYDSPSQLVNSVKDYPVIINLIGIIRETKETSFDFAHHLIPMSLVKAAQDGGVKRFLQMSALGAGGKIDTEYMETKRLGENVVKSSGLDYTIFRPSVVYGPDDHLTSMIAKAIRLAPFFPVIGDGQYKFQPVSVFNVADAFVRAIDKPETFGKTYDIAGPDTFTFDEMLDTVAKAMGKSKARKIHFPAGLIMLKARLFGRLMPGPLSVDTIKMLLAGSTSDDDAVFGELGITPDKFKDSIIEYIKK